MKSIILFFAFLLSFTHSIGQTCLLDGILFQTQTAINSFPVNHPNCSEILGDVTIYGDAISSIDSLKSLIKINGALAIRSTNLQNLNGLQNTSSIGKDLLITSNPVLESLNGIQNIHSLGGAFRIENNNELTSLTAITNIAKVPYQLRISGNEKLTTLHGLGSIKTAKDVVIYNNLALENFDGLRLDSIFGYLKIENNPSLLNLSDIAYLKYIGTELTIRINNKLPHLESFVQTNMNDVTSINISENNILSNCDGTAICHYLFYNENILYLENNATGCNRLAELEMACIFLGNNEFISKNSLNIFPNPASNSIYITNKNTPFTATILNLEGDIISKHYIPQNDTEIDLSQLPNGSYLFQKHTEGKTISERIILSK